MDQSFKLAICQMQVQTDKQKNINKAREMIGQAAANGADIVVLPEMFNCPYINEYFPRYAESYPNGETVKMLAAAARSAAVTLIGGSIPEQDQNQVYNTSFIFGPDGRLLKRHRKMHLFDIDLPGKLSFKESDTLSAGNQITVFNTAFCPLGVAICYDIRFPELLRLMALQGAKLVILPANYSTTTGEAHWELLLRMRAVDNQFFVAGAAPARGSKANYTVYGHSMIVNPWGKVIARASEEESIIYADIDLAQVAQVRSELPLLLHRRLDIYELKQIPLALGKSQN